ncbi:flagellar protein FlgN [Arthrobacter sp. GMC3]|uniref:flagellar protein FlgN n=1 Tax=Arthrobacter sp. GMC3 TaxID=2058894 RepID=UPI000CE3BE2D|nr:flagellar protein FlgN [Arthrobacter sp. GMC3]
MGPQELTAALWRERELLDLLVFKLEEEHLVLASGKSRWLDHATREVEHVMTRLRVTSLERTTIASAVALQWGLPEDASLQELSAAGGAGPWAEILGSHLAALSGAVDQVRTLRDTNLQFLREGLRSAQETMATVVADAGTYDHLGNTSTEPGSRFLDKSV